MGKILLLNYSSKQGASNLQTWSSLRPFLEPSVGFVVSLLQTIKICSVIFFIFLMEKYAISIQSILVFSSHAFLFKCRGENNQSGSNPFALKSITGHGFSKIHLFSDALEVVKAIKGDGVWSIHFYILIY